ncbi:hypothetical protein HanXRQr2_Chr15g0718831 [Helianthus annuus]|uniref:Uncharacterized protein n=1 Tax=Helianthus annuus TaxID=4232 RepID=A0A9K3E4G1_HELAN|nr:hypothetical protein HanXRQr2_Chr15g0718831 [Helianthus annuus]KAJ0833374.1 hypothetical protein HanPSC8_Chr15g0689651 [Helianthus annuus]
MREGLIAIANNEDVEDVLEEEPVDCIENETDDELEDGIGDETQMDGDGISYGNVQVPSTYTNLEETNITMMTIG